MKVFKVDLELNQVIDEWELDINSLKDDHDLGLSDELLIFSKFKPSSIWIDRGLMSNITPLVRIRIKECPDGTEYRIIPTVSTLKGSIVLNNPSGNYRYNLILRHNEQNFISKAKVSPTD